MSDLPTIVSQNTPTFVALAAEMERLQLRLEAIEAEGLALLASERKLIAAELAQGRSQRAQLAAPGGQSDPDHTSGASGVGNEPVTGAAG